MPLQSTPGGELPLQLPAEDELAVVKRAANGDQAAFAWIMRRYNRRLYRLARASLHDAADAKDALQESFLAAYRALGQFRGESSLATWLARIVLNECMARQRRSKRRQNVVPMMSLESQPEITREIEDPAEQAEGALARAQMREILESRVNALPESLRLVFVLRSVEELSVEETSTHLGISEEAVRTRHFRAKRLLRDGIAKVIDSVEREIYEFGGCECDGVVANVLCRL